MIKSVVTLICVNFLSYAADTSPSLYVVTVQNGNMGVINLKEDKPGPAFKIRASIRRRHFTQCPVF